jgi:hypothetical protein
MTRTAESPQTNCYDCPEGQALARTRPEHKAADESRATVRLPSNVKKVSRREDT